MYKTKQYFDEIHHVTNSLTAEQKVRTLLGREDFNSSPWTVK